MPAARWVLQRVPSSSSHRLIRLTLLAAVLLLLWDAGPGDLWLAQAMGGAQSFPLRDNWLTKTVLHEGARGALWLLSIGLVLAIVKGWGVFAPLPRLRKAQLIVVPLLASGVVALIKGISQTSCPWSLAEFGGQASYLSHWLGWFNADGGSGRCFPAGHASVGFAFVGGWFALRPYNRRWAKGWLLAALVVGLVLGLAQQWRGAHFMSHTLWTAWLCWNVGLLADAVFTRYTPGASRRLHTPRSLGQPLSALSAWLTQAQPAWAVLVLTCGWMVLTGNAPLWRRLTELNLLSGPSGTLLAVGIVIMLWSALLALVSLVAWHKALKPVLTVLLWVTALNAYFSGAYGVLMTPAMMTNVMQTDMHEARDLLSDALVWHLLWFALLPSLWLWQVRVVFASWRRQLWQQPVLCVVGIAVLLLTAWGEFQPFSSAMRNHKDVRYLFNPLAALYATVSAAARDREHGVRPLQTIADDARINTANGARPRLLMLVVGETGRSHNFSLNGYERPTNQPLDGSDVVSFTNAWACGTSTAESLPCMFSHLPRVEHIKANARYENLLDVLYKAGFAVLWLDNQSGCKGVCDRVPNLNTCTDDVCMDKDMLDGLDARLAALDPERRARGVVLVLHQMGSHGPAYSLRSPPELKHFEPECTTADLAQCSPEHIRNAYDNSLIYTSDMLAQSIAWLSSQAKQYDTVMLYAADHGESLGENNLYLHGMPYAFAPREQKHIPWLTWISPTFADHGTALLRCLQSRRDTQISHDFIFHSVLGIMNVATAIYRPELDMFAGCRGNL